MTTINLPPAMTLEETLANPDTPAYIRDFLQHSLRRHPVVALNDAQVCVALLQERYDAWRAAKPTRGGAA